MRPAVEGTCSQARLRLSSALDGEAAAPDVQFALTHIAGCERCQVFATHVLELTRELRSVGHGRTELPSLHQLTGGTT